MTRAVVLRSRTRPDAADDNEPPAPTAGRLVGSYP